MPHNNTTLPACRPHHSTHHSYHLQLSLKLQRHHLQHLPLSLQPRPRQIHLQQRSRLRPPTSNHPKHRKRRSQGHRHPPHLHLLPHPLHTHRSLLLVAISIYPLLLHVRAEVSALQIHASQLRKRSIFQLVTQNHYDFCHFVLNRHPDSNNNRVLLLYHT